MSRRALRQSREWRRHFAMYAVVSMVGMAALEAPETIYTEPVCEPMCIGTDLCVDGEVRQ